MSDWYYADTENRRQGPVDTAALARMRRDGWIQWSTLVWRDGMAQWQPLGDFAEEVAGQGAAPVLDVSAGTLAAPPDSPYAPPNAPLRGDGGVHLGGEIVYAGFWKRFAAYSIDGFLMGIVSYAVQLPLMFLLFRGMDSTKAFGAGAGGALAGLYLVPIIIQMVYYAWFHSSSHQATPGKMAIGIKVVGDNGQRISFMHGVGRYFAFLLSGFTIGVGYIMAGLTDRKRALHDMVASTLVVDRWAFTEHPEQQRRELGTVTIVVLVLAGVMILGLIAVMVAAIGVASQMGH